MKRLIQRKFTKEARAHRRASRWSPVLTALLGGFIAAGAVMWAMAMVHIAARHL